MGEDRLTDRTVAELCERGLAWESSGSLCLPERLEAHWLAEIGGGRPVAKIAGSVFAENLRSAAVSRLLNDSAVAETHGATRTWRFTSASVRGALDTGWTAQELLTELAAISARPVPQPLEYLITDASRRYGQVRVRGMRSCVIADETLVTEILRTRSLTKLHLSRLAPTVLSSPSSLDDVLARRREVGLPRWQKTP